jgi:hypothetical protein
MSKGDELQWYVPGFVGRRQRPRASSGTAKSEEGSIVSVRMTPDGNRAPAPRGVSRAVALRPVDSGPTRYSLALRRQASNRVRQGKGDARLPPIRPGTCEACDGWGVVGATRGRCSRCQGTGDA